MIVYEGIKETFIEEVKLNIIANKIYEKYQSKIGKTSENEIRSWKNSMRFMKDVLEDAEIPNDAGIAIEFKIPNTGMRIDFMISGIDEDGKPKVFLVKDAALAEQIAGLESTKLIQDHQNVVVGVE